MNEPTMGPQDEDQHSLGYVVDHACDEFESALQKGEGARIEDFLARVAADQRGVLLRELLILDVSYRRQRGEKPEARDYFQRFSAEVELVTNVLGEHEANAPNTHSLHKSAGASDSIGSLVGPYKLLSVLGEGGFGTVYLADQEEPIRRRVALKIIKAGMDTHQVLARFEAERQVLAMMDHPHIAKVFDAGSTDTGRSYFVMELVHGEPITDYCDRHKLTLEERLELFTAVCQAVQHAHQKGIIHRDIKPKNVLVSVVDDRPMPKVIDFGIAKATAQPLTQQTIFTEQGQLIGTPEYMSPEQAEMSNLDIDTRSDIYSLGVLLYELLTGVLPFDRCALRRAGFDEIRRIIREVEPPKPSTKISTLGADSQNLAVNRRTDSQSLRRRLRQELDWIVMKTLEKDRTRRYATALALAEDIQHYLQREPVQAGPPGSWYRIRKYARHYRLPIGIAAGFVGLLLAITALAVRGYYRETSLRSEAERQKTRAEAGEKLATERLAQVEAEKQRAEEERRIAQAVRDFLQTKLLGQANVREQANSLLRGGGSSAGAKLNPTIRELLDRTAAQMAPEKIEANFPKQPLLQAEILRTVGNAYRGVGKYQRSIDFLERAVALYRTKLGADHLDTLASVGCLALAYDDAGKLDLALPLYDETLRLMKSKLGPDHPDTLTSMNNLAGAYLDAGKPDLALPLYEETLDLEKSKLGPSHPETLAIMSNLANAYRDAGELDLALPLLEETLKLRKAKLGPDHPDTLTTMNNLAGAYQDAGKLDLTLPLLEETLKLTKAKLGPDHPSTLTSMNNLAMAYRAAGKLDLALPLLEETLKLTKAKLGPDHPDTLTSMHNLAAAYEDAGKLDLALPLLEETLKLRKAKLGPHHPDTLTTMNNLAGAYWRAKKLDKSIPLFEETLRFREVKLGRQHPDTLITVANLGVNYKDAGRVAEALPLLEEAYRAARKHPSLRWVEILLLDNYVRVGKNQEAVALANKMLADARRELPKQSPQLAKQSVSIAYLLLQARAFPQAESLLRECLAIREKMEPEAWTTLNTKSLLGGALLAQKKYAAAEPLLVGGYMGMRQREAKIPPQGRVHVDEALERLVQLAKAMGKRQEEVKWQTELEARKKSAPQPPTRKASRQGN